MANDSAPAGTPAPAPDPAAEALARADDALRLAGRLIDALAAAGWPAGSREQLHAALACVEAAFVGVMTGQAQAVETLAAALEAARSRPWLN